MKFCKCIIALLVVFFLMAGLLACNNDYPGNSDSSTPVPAEKLILAANGISNYQIVYPEGAPDALVAAASKLKGSVETSGGVAINWVEDFFQEGGYDPRSDYEILIGNVNREESAGVSDGLRYDDYVIRVVNKKILITGGSDDAVIKAVDEFIASYCHEDGVYLLSDTNVMYRHKYACNSLTLLGQGIAKYEILCANDYYWDRANELRDTIFEKTGYHLNVVRRYTDGKPTIVLGTDAYSFDSLPTIVDGDWYWQQDKANLIVGGSDEAAVLTGIVNLIENISEISGDVTINEPNTVNSDWITSVDPTKPSETKPDVIFAVDGSQNAGKVISNKSSLLVMWDHKEWGFGPGEEHAPHFQENMPFIEYITVMNATGGWLERDLFENPSDPSVTDDYDFSELIAYCRNVLVQGAKPYIKTGMIPLKLSFRTTEEILNYVSGAFGQNKQEPYDYDLYFDYIAAIAQAMVDEFGLEEVQSWRWGVLTEFENSEWLDVGTPEATCVAYCKIYDYTVAALQSVIGKDIWVCAHSQTIETSYWNMRDFVKHCSAGTNYYTGETGSHISGLAISYYDITPEQMITSGKLLGETLAELRTYAESIGLYGLSYGTEEGRILSGMDGRQLSTRIVGHTYQAGFDASLLKQAIDYDIDYLMQWNMYANNSLNVMEGIKTVSYHVANRFHYMVGSSLLGSEKTYNNIRPNIECEIVASHNTETNTVYVMGYNFKREMLYDGTKVMRLKLDLPMFEGDVKVTRYVVDDDCNFFDEWYPNCQENGGYSVDSVPQFSNSFSPTVYEKYTHLIPARGVAELKDGVLTLDAELTGNAVVFYVIEACNE